MVLVNANGKVGQMGALADFIEVEPQLRARRRSVPRRSAAARAGRAARARVRRLEADSPGRRRPLRLRRRRARGTESQVSTEVHHERRHGVDVPLDVLVDPDSGGALSSSRAEGAVMLSSVVRDRRAVPAGDSGGDGRRADRRVVRDRGARLRRRCRIRWRRSKATSSAARTSSPAATRPSRAAFSPPSARSRSCARRSPSRARRSSG